MIVYKSGEGFFNSLFYVNRGEQRILPLRLSIISAGSLIKFLPHIAVALPLNLRILSQNKGDLGGAAGGTIAPGEQDHKKSEKRWPYSSMGSGKYYEQ